MQPTPIPGSARTDTESALLAQLEIRCQPAFQGSRTPGLDITSWQAGSHSHALGVPLPAVQLESMIGGDAPAH